MRSVESRVGAFARSLYYACGSHRRVKIPHDVTISRDVPHNRVALFKELQRIRDVFLLQVVG